MATITIPLGATVKVRRANGTTDKFVFRGTDAKGPIFEDAAGNTHRDLGEWLSIEIDKPGAP